MQCIRQYYGAESSEETMAILTYFKTLGMRFDETANRSFKRRCVKSGDRCLLFMFSGGLWDIATGNRQTHEQTRVVCDLEDIIEQGNRYTLTEQYNKNHTKHTKISPPKPQQHYLSISKHYSSISKSKLISSISKSKLMTNIGRDGRIPDNYY